MDGKINLQFLLITCVISIVTLTMLPGLLAAIPEPLDPSQAAAGDFLVVTCPVDRLEMSPGSTKEIECIGVNTTPNTTGHKVMTGGNVPGDFVNIVTYPPEFDETPYNVENKFSVTFEVSFDTTPGNYSAEVYMKGYDTNRAPFLIELGVKWPEVDDAEITPWEAKVYPGGQQQFEINVYNSQGNVISKIPVIWDAEKGLIDENGLYTAPDYAVDDQIYATFPGILEEPFIANVYVQWPLTTIEVTPSQATMKTGERQVFTAVGKDSQGNEAPFIPVWSANGGEINSDGVFTAPKTTGEYLINVGEQGSDVSGSAVVTVQPDVAAIVVSPSGAALYKGGEQKFSATAYDNEDNEVPFIPLWETRGGKITESGLYTAPDALGEYKVTAGMADSPVTGSAVVSVKPNITSVVVSPSEARVRIGEQQQFSATAYDPDGLVVPFLPLWEAAGGKISADGLYTAAQKGSQTVTATQQGGAASGSAIVTVLGLIPIWAWVLLILACLGLVGFLIWILFCGRGEKIPWWLWMLVGLCGVVLIWFLLWYFLGLW